MTVSPARRRYDSSGRRARAAETGRRIVEAAGRRFSEGGYAQSTIAAIAEEAEVSVATVYSQFGKKESLLEHWLLSVTADAQERPATQQDWFLELAGAEDFETGVSAFAQGTCSILERVHSAYALAREAGRSDPAVKAIYKKMSDDRLAGLTLAAGFLADLAHVEPRDDVETLGEFLWAVVSPSLFESLITDRGWAPEQYREHVIKVTRAVFGAEPQPAAQPS